MEAARIYDFKQDTISMVNEYTAKNKISKDEFAKRIGFSRPALSQYLSGTYSNPANIEKAVLDFFKSEGIVEKKHTNSLKSVISKGNFYPTRDAKKIIGVCQSCQEAQGLGIISGKSGFGKTYALKHYAKMQKVAYIYCDDTMSSKDLIEAIEDELGIPQKYGSINRRVKGIKKFFQVNSGYLLIIDEADKLLNKYTQKKMEILRSIYDPQDKNSEESEVGLIIAGEPRLESLIKVYIPRFANRADFNVRLEGLSKAEVEEYLDGYGFVNEALDEMTFRATNNQTGCFRLLNKTLRNIVRLQSDSDEEISLAIINKASSMMML